MISSQRHFLENEFSEKFLVTRSQTREKSGSKNGVLVGNKGVGKVTYNVEAK